MSVEVRLEQILNELRTAKEPVAARKLAKKFDVSRQIIVGDIARLRAAGEDILSTPKGYLLNVHVDHEIKKKIVCQHTIEETADEINTIIVMGGKLLDVSVEHPVYGEITGTLNLFDQADADQFNRKVEAGETSLLLELTKGVHVHTIAADTMEELEQIVSELDAKGYLYKSD